MSEHQNERPNSPAGGDERTPDMAQGQIKYAQGQTKPKESGAREPQKTIPEKQGGIGGP